MAALHIVRRGLLDICQMCIIYSTLLENTTLMLWWRSPFRMPCEKLPRQKSLSLKRPQTEALKVNIYRPQPTEWCLLRAVCIIAYYLLTVTLRISEVPL